jgi:hypothetical protein
MDADVAAIILLLATTDIPPLSTIHQFVGGGSTAAFSDSNSAAGLGDVVLRGKYRFYSGSGGGLAAGVDLRLPSGKSEDLLGLGAASATFSLIGSGTNGRFGPHFNIGFARSGESDTLSIDVKNEFDYKFGTEYVASPRLTLGADLLGRRLINSGVLNLESVVHAYRDVNGVAGSRTFQEYVSKEGSLTMTDLAVGAKFNVTGNLLVNAAARIAVSDKGVTARVTPVLGFDYTF